MPMKCRINFLYFNSYQSMHNSRLAIVLFFEKGGGDHLRPPTYQETVPITNALTARIRLWKNFKVFFNSCTPFCCNSCHFAALKPPYYNTCAASKGGGGGGGDFQKGGGGGGGGSPPSPSPLYESLEYWPLHLSQMELIHCTRT